MTADVASPLIETTGDTHIQVRRARKNLLVFAGFLVSLSILGYWIWGTFPEAPFILPSLMVSLSPAIASVFTRLVMHGGFKDVSFRLRGPRMGGAFLLALLFPFIVGAVAYGFMYLTGLAEFDPPPFPVAAGSPLGQFGAILAFSLVGILLLLIPDAGEEIGWRGYLLLRMIDARLPRPVNLSSLVWGA
jgi:membrane protease YdiL (CAAX protease family)